MSYVPASFCSIYWQGRRDRCAGIYRGDHVPENARCHYDRGWKDGASPYTYCDPDDTLVQ